jgi:hypothetical protein
MERAGPVAGAGGRRAHGREEKPSMDRPRAPIRRFDVFAEYNRQKAIADGVPPDEAEGYGLWVAKVVASRSFGGSISSQAPSKVREQAHAREAQDATDSGSTARPKWHALKGEPQTDELFQDQIVQRMGREFYDTVFAPAIAQAVSEGRAYNAIRDTIRKDWTP